MNARKIIEAYFALEEIGDVDGVVALCSPSVTIRNAANPPQFGRDGAREYVSSFASRTESRHFHARAIAIEGDVAFAWWDANLRFCGGITIGPFTAKQPFELFLEGVCVFSFDGDGLIASLGIFHETTSILRKIETVAG